MGDNLDYARGEETPVPFTDAELEEVMQWLAISQINFAKVGILVLHESQKYAWSEQERLRAALEQIALLRRPWENHACSDGSCAVCMAAKALRGEALR